MNAKIILAQCSFLICSALAIVMPVNAEEIRIEGAAINQSVNCNGDSLVISGASNTVRASGHCNSIEINGAGVRVEADSVSRIKITGASSTVLYKKSPNKNGKASVSIIGAGSSAKKR